MAADSREAEQKCQNANAGPQKTMFMPYKDAGLSRMVKSALSVGSGDTALITSKVENENTVLVIVFSWKFTSRTEIQLIMQIGICACFAGHVIWALWMNETL